MATEPSSSPASSTAPSAAERGGLFASLGHRAARAWERIEPLLVRASDWLNPILVKETRQALKSRQFVITFLLVLIACWVVTIGGVALIGPPIHYSAAGGQMLFAYYVILAFPLALVVPYSAFRSLAAEREDNTYDMLSITALKPRQIISGKLGSAAAQMAVYYSAVAPCLAFTYLLRGVDLPTISTLLVYSFFGSLGLSMIGLLLATLSRQRYGQVILSAVFIVGLCFMFVMALAFAEFLIYEGYLLYVEGFLVMNLALFTLYATTFALFYFAAAGMITFASENRSTPLRIVMLLQQACWVGWMGVAWILNDYDLVVVLVLVAVAVVYWYATGAALTSERPFMSERMKRRLPTSFLGRVFRTWLNPGPASGYMFVIANTTALAFLVLVALAYMASTGRGGAGRLSSQEMITLVFIGWGYLIAYLGLGLLILRAIRRVATVTLLAGVLIQLLVLLAGSGIPTTVQLMSPELRNYDYTLLQLSNPFWTLIYMADRGLPHEATVVLLVVSAAAICVLLLNLPGVVRELRQVRVDLPARVATDEQELHPPPEARPTSPWEAGE